MSPIQLKSSIDSKEYYNTIYAKNLLVYFSSDSDFDTYPIAKGWRTIKANEQVNFTHWVDISKTVGEKITTTGTDTVTLLSIYTGSFYSITYNRATKSLYCKFKFRI